MTDVFGVSGIRGVRVHKNFGAAMGGLTRNHGACYGCRACELACSFHHLGVFSPGGGAIRVRKDNRTGKIEWTRSTQCDLCNGEVEPLCVRYCFYGALSQPREGA